jgi:hypothetical protein
LLELGKVFNRSGGINSKFPNPLILVKHLSDVQFFLLQF